MCSSKTEGEVPLVTVYTCNVNNYDVVLPPLTDDSNLIFVCFTDRPKKRLKGWDVRSLQSPPDITNPTLINRYHKFFPHKLGFEADWSIYVDGNMRVLGPVSDLVSEVQTAGAVMACLEHPWRSTVEEEIEACERAGKISGNDVQTAHQQLRRYLNEGMPVNATLVENKVIVRRHNDPDLQEAMETWWYELQNNVKRDQLSLPYVIWKHNLSFTSIGLSSWQKKSFFRRYGHRTTGLAGFRQLISLRCDELGFKVICSFVAPVWRLMRKIVH